MMLVFLINDDDGVAACERDDIVEAIPGAKVRIFDNAIDAFIASASARPAIIVVDISAVGSLVIGPQSCYSAICALADRVPGATIIINSAVSSGFAQDVLDLVKERCPDSVVKLVDRARGDGFESFVRTLKECA